MQRFARDDKSIVQINGRAREAYRGQKWRRPDRVCGECVFGMPYVHDGGIYVVIKCTAGIGFPFRGHYQRACGMYQYNTALAAFRKSCVENAREARSPGQGRQTLQGKSVGQGIVDEASEDYPF